tara:strand:- start:660 stop:908 length:249 start_codon:yes stop_codon:yes gene_type:complete
MSGHLTREEKNKWKDEVLESRMNDFKTLKKQLKEKGVEYTEKTNGIHVKELFIFYDLRVCFGSRKTYQYNLEGIIDRLSKIV